MRALLLALPAAIVAGCAPGPFDDSLAALAEHDLGPLPDGERMLLERAAAGGPAPRSSLADLPDAAGAEDYVRLALERNPSLRAAEQRVLRLQERIPQVTSLDDPLLEVAPIGEMAETAAGQVGVMTGVSQRLPFPGKLATRGRIAAREVAVAEQELERARLTVAADTRRAWWSLYDAVRAIEITRRSRGLLAQLREVAQAKYRAGTATQEAVLRASVELNSLDAELVTLEQRRTSAAAMLNSLIDRPVDSILPDPAPVELVAFEGRRRELLEAAERSNPDLRAIRERIEMFHDQRRLARLDRWPDLSVSASYNLVENDGLSAVANGDDQWWIGFGVNLPLWQARRAAAEREATRGILESAGALADERNRVAFRVQDALVKVESAQRQALLVRDVIIPEAMQTVEASLSGYRGGEVDFLTLVDNWRNLLDFQLMYQSMITELERSCAALAEAVGREIPRREPETDDGAAPRQPAEDER